MNAHKPAPTRCATPVRYTRASRSGLLLPKIFRFLGTNARTERDRAGGFAIHGRLLGIFLAAALTPVGLARAVSPADLVDPRIGVSNGSTVIGPALPQGSIHPSPDTPGGGTDGYTPHQPIRGFSQLHASGTGWGTWGNVLLSPQVGLDISRDGHDSPKGEELAQAYAYRVVLARYGITAEVTPTHHAAIYRFTYPEGDQGHLSLDLAHQVPGNTVERPEGKPGKGVLTLDPATRSFSGSSTYSGGWAVGTYTVFFYAELDQPGAEQGTWKTTATTSATTNTLHIKAEADGERVGGWWRFDGKTARTVQVKIAVSFHSVERAREHLKREIPGWDFDTVKAAAKAAWNDGIGRIAVTGGSEAQRTQFATAMYHAQLMPRDRTGEFRRFGDAPMWDDHFAIWDTWRTKFPLMVLIRPEVVRGNIQSFITRLRVDGRVRDSFCAGNDQTDDQGGNNLDNIIADAYVKKVKGIDWEAAFGVLKHNATKERKGMNRQGEEDYRRQGWIRAGRMSVSCSLEYAYNDFVAAQVAQGLGKNEEAAAWSARARQWQQLFNPASESDGFKGFIVPKTATGAWAEVDLKKDYGSWKDFYYEATAWNYSFFVPHQAGLLIDLMGGKEVFTSRLEAGITGSLNDNKTLIWIGNEPAFLAPHLFHYAGRPDLASKHVKNLIRTRFTLRGYPGDDDSGAMSSYYVFASLGLFPNAGQDLYFLNGPMFDRLVVTRPEEGKLEITRTGSGDYVAGLTVNGKPWNRSWIRHTEMKGDTVLAFTMSETPTAWGTQTPPPSDTARAQ